MDIIRQAISKCSLLTRSDLLKYKPKLSNERIPMVFDYHPCTESLYKILKHEFSRLKSDSSLEELFRAPPIIARRQPRNRRSVLTSSKLRTADNHGNFMCRKPRCQLCEVFNTSEEVRLPGILRPIKTPPLNCDSANVIYILYCDACNDGNYVGQTGGKFRFRFNNHRKSIRDESNNYPVSRHFNLPDHSYDDINCILVDSGFSSTTSRLKCEHKWILKLKTNSKGLNSDLGILSGFTFAR